MKIAVWNIRGLGSVEKKVTVRKLIKDEHIDMMGLVETKHSDFSLWDIRKIWGNQDVGWVHSSAVNGSGGLVVFWHHDAFKGIRSLITQRWICVFGKFLEEDFECAVCVVYAPNNQRERLELWNDLRAVRQQMSSPLVMMGDFNEVLTIEERRNATQRTVGMRDLGDFIQDL